ncbi:hypothetical protein H9X57_14020 [Flavobacterium piscinae]|nr:hypothetical protein [Flavobacterium piscinae]MBC8884042.1 hypothetical protein [Flavobacterium piscinae]
MQKNGISQFYYTHLPVNNANTGILFYGKIQQGRLIVSIVPTRLSINNEKFVYEVLEDKTDFKITTHSKGNLLLKGENTKWKLISTGNNFESLPFETNNYLERISSNNLTLNYQELMQIYEEMMAKREHLAIGNKENRIKELSKVIQKQLENPFYQTVKLCVYIKQVDAQGNVIGENLLKTDYKTKECEVRLNITIKPGEKIEIKHVVHPNFLKEYEDKWKKEARARGLDVDISQMRKESNEEFEKKETEYNFYQKFIQQSKALFNDKIGGYVEAIQATQKVAKNVWAEGTVYKSNWHSKDDDHKNWPEYMQFEPIVGGVTDGAIDEIIGIKMAITTVYDIATDEEKRNAFSQVFTAQGMEQMYAGLKQEAEEIYKDTERSEHFVGKTTVAVGSMFLGGIGLFTKAGKLGEVLDSVSGFIKRITNPKVVKVYEDIRNFFLKKPKDGGIEVNDYLKKLDDDALNELGEELAEDVGMLDNLKKAPKNFILGKNLEKNVERLIQSNDSNFLSKIAEKAGITIEEIANYIPLQQVQINLPTGGFTIADNVWIKTVKVGDEIRYDVIVNEVKLSKATDFTKRQNEFIEAIGKQDSKFKLRNTKFTEEYDLPQGTELNIKTYIKTYSKDSNDLTNNLDFEKIK